MTRRLIGKMTCTTWYSSALQVFYDSRKQGFRYYDRVLKPYISTRNLSYKSLRIATLDKDVQSAQGFELDSLHMHHSQLDG